jgi:L-Ala-D/L-Glu epimerase
MKFWRVQLRLTHPWSIARGSGMGIREVVMVELTGEDGSVGLGEAAPISRYHESPETVEAFCKQIDPRQLAFDDPAGSTAYLASLSRHDQAAKCALNVALLDGAAKRAGLPLYDFLGLGFREGCHVTSFSIGIAPPGRIQLKVAEAEAYPVLKMKLGVAGDKANLQALRCIAPTKPLRVDANEGWKTKEHALEMIEWLAADEFIQFVEQPMPASTPIKDWAWLKERSPLLIIGDESFHSAGDATRCAECFHGVNVKLVKTGGISGGLEALRAARAAGLKTMLGCMIETSVLISAAAHLAELCDYLDLDGNALIANDPYLGVKTEQGVLSFARAPEPFGLRVRCRRPGDALPVQP